MKKVYQLLTVVMLLFMASVKVVAQEAYAVYNNGVLTFYYDNLKSTRAGTVYPIKYDDSNPGWYDDHCTDITKAVFDASFANARPTRTIRWFAAGEGTSKLQEIVGLEYLNTSEVLSMSHMFQGCRLLTTLDISNFNTRKVVNMDAMFNWCCNLTTIYCGDDWSTERISNIYSAYHMMGACEKLVGGKGTAYSGERIHHEYAHSDGGWSNPGYFTFKGKGEDVEGNKIVFFKGKTIENVEMTFQITNEEKKTCAVGNGYLQAVDESTSGKITIPSTINGYTVTEIKEKALAYLPNVTSVYIPDEVTSIRQEAFRNCAILEEVRLPSYLTKLTWSVFIFCGNLHDINIPNTITDIDAYAFAYTGLKSVVIPESVNSMAHHAFQLCAIESVELPNKVINIQNDVFSGAALKKVISHIEDPYEIPDAFSGVYENATLYVPKGTVDKYKATSYWNQFTNIQVIGEEEHESDTKEAYAIFNDDNGVLTFYYDEWKNVREGVFYRMNSGESEPGWYSEHRNDIKKAVFDPSFALARPTSTHKWFASWYYETSILSEIEGLEYLNTSEVTTMRCMFQFSHQLKSISPGRNWDTSKVTDMCYMFDNSGLTSLDASSWDTSNVTNMEVMFGGSSDLETLNLSGWNTAKVVTMREFLRNCEKLKEVDLSSFETAKVTNMGGMFDRCYQLKTIYGGDGWSTESLESSDNMFRDCSSLVGGSGTTYSSSHTDATYAHIDGGPSNPGYFTSKNGGIQIEDGTFTAEVFQGASMVFKVIDEEKKLVQVGNGTEAAIDPATAGDITIPSTVNGYTVVGIGDYGFYNCAELTAVWLPETIEFIGAYAFYGCKKLGKIQIPEAVYAIDPSAFQGCSGLTDVTCPLLPGIEDLFPNAQLTIIGYKASDEAYDVVIPKPVKSIGERAFSHLPNIRTMRVEEGNTVFDSREDCNAIIRTADNTLLFGCKSTTIPESVTAIGEYAFEGHTGLTAIEVPASVATIGHGAFSECTGLETVTSQITTPYAINDNVFSQETYQTARLLVPYGQRSLYAQTAGWKNFLNIEEMEPEVKEAYAVYTDDGTLTFYYDNKKSTREGTAYELNTGYNKPGWTTDHAADIKKAVFTSSFEDARPTSTYSWFYANWDSNEKKYVSQLSEIEGIEYLNTSNVTNMNTMFYGCSSLTSLDVSGFDTGKVTSMGQMFQGCSRLTSLDVSGFDTRNVKGMFGMFRDCSGLTSLDVSGFDTRNVTDMEWMFRGCRGLTSLDVRGFETGKVEDMCDMFSSCRGLTSLDVSDFDTGNVTDMGCMFDGCSGLTSLDVSGFDTRNVKGMFGMFRGCSGLTSLDVSGFNTGNVTDMREMFNGCSVLMSLDVSGWNTGNVTDMGYMFHRCSGLTSLDVSGFETGNVVDMRSMFFGCSGLTSLDVSGFNTGNVTSMRGMFYGCSGLMSLDVSGWNTGNVTDMGSMFRGCSGLTSLDVSGFDTGNVKGMFGMFRECSSMTRLDLSGFDTGNVTDMGWMFSDCSGLTSLDVSGFNTGNVTDMGYMFNGCSGLTSLDVSGFDTGNVTSMRGMFYGCSGLTSLDVSGFDTRNVTFMYYMFYCCSGLTNLDLSGFDTGNVTDMFDMFYGCSVLTTIYCGDNWNTDKVTSSDGMFYNCTSLVGGKGTVFDASHTDKEYARIDGGPSTPGYLTKKQDIVDLEPIDIDENQNFSDKVDEDTDLSGTVIDNVYYTIGADEGGYDAAEQCLLLNRQMTEEEILNNVLGRIVGSDELKRDFSGIIFEVPAGKGIVSITMQTTGTSVLKVRFGEKTPYSISLQGGKITAQFPYEVSVPTYVYIYAGPGAGAVNAKRNAPSASPNCVKLYGFSHHVETPAIPTDIDAVGDGGDEEVIRFSLDGTPLSGARPGVNIVRMKDGTVRKVVVK